VSADKQPTVADQEASGPDGPTPDGPDQPELSKAERTRQAILERAIERFGRDGFRATSVADISRDAEVSGSLAYAYFKDKEDLFVASVNHDAALLIREGTVNLLAGELSSGPELDAFGDLLDAMDRHPLTKRILAGQEPFVTHLLLELDAVDDAAAKAADRLTEGQEAGVVRADIDPKVAGRAGVNLWIVAMMAAAQFGRDKATEEFRLIQTIFNKGLFAD
jgi:AcrR family transcriptional regulator